MHQRIVGASAAQAASIFERYAEDWERLANEAAREGDKRLTDARFAESTACIRKADRLRTLAAN